MKRVLIIAFAGALISSLSAAPAIATPCRGYELTVRQTSGESYDPAALQPENLRLELATNEQDLPNGCVSAEVEVRTIDLGALTLRGPGGVLQASYQRSNVTGRQTVSTVNINGNGRNDLVRNQRLEFDYLQIDPGQFVAPGIYMAEIEAVAGRGTPVRLQVQVIVEPALRFVSLASGSIVNLSLGEVTNGGSAQNSFMLKSNASIAVTARSENQGTMVHGLGRGYGAIPYRAFLSGNELDLQQEVATRLAVAPNQLRSETMRVEVAPQSGRYAGKYEDTLVLEFTAF